MKRNHLIAAVFALAVLVAGSALAIPPFIGSMGEMLAGATKAALHSSDTISVRSAPTTAAQHAAKNEALSTDEETAHAIEPDEYSSRLAQNFRIINLDAAINICVDVKARTVSAPATTCATICAASTVVCGVTDSDTNGAVVAAGKPYTIAITGNDCLCAVAASGTPVINIEQVNRLIP